MQPPKSITNTSHDIIKLGEVQAQETISILHRTLMLAKYSNLKIELEAVIRMLGNNTCEITYQQLEKLALRHSELLDTALNPRG